MKKQTLLSILDASLLKVDVSTAPLYEKYFPLIERELKSMDGKVPEPLPGEFGSKSEWDCFIRSHGTDEVGRALRALLNLLRTAAVCRSPDETPTGAEQEHMREKAAERMESIFLRPDAEGEELLTCLRNAARTLRGMFLPKNDRHVLTCYLNLMEILDEIPSSEDLLSERERIEKIISEWKALNRG